MFCYKDKYHDDANFGTRLSVRLIEGVSLNWGALNRGSIIKAVGVGVVVGVVSASD